MFFAVKVKRYFWNLLLALCGYDFDSDHSDDYHTRGLHPHRHEGNRC